MAVKHIVDKALKTPMSRKEFLGHMGALLLAVVGVTSILHSLGLHDAVQQKGSRGSVAGASGAYGSSAYGG
jgi:hypothetical protein